ncbi:MAG: relaxase/mobilization nuclease domain-containing protein [Pararobbsia sp.]
MILKASQRSGARQLATHLLNARDNEHVEVHELRGFSSDKLSAAFQEVEAVSRGTRAKQFLFSLSLSPPPRERVTVEQFEQAIDAAERKLGLNDQPRAIVFHEKEGRRHAHVVWSRIDVERMKAINMPHFKRRLQEVSRDLYREHGWTMPRGLITSKERDPEISAAANGNRPRTPNKTPRH